MNLQFITGLHDVTAIVATQAVPEPATLSFLIGSALLLGIRRTQRAG